MRQGAKGFTSTRCAGFGWRGGWVAFFVFLLFLFRFVSFGVRYDIGGRKEGRKERRKDGKGVIRGR